MGCRNGKTSDQKTLEWEHAYTIFLDNRPVIIWFFLLLEVLERFSFCKGCVISKVSKGTKSPFFFLCGLGKTEGYRLRRN